MVKYSSANFIHDFHGAETIIGDTVIFADPSSCSKDDTPLKRGVVTYILYLGYNFQECKYKIGISVPSHKWSGMNMVQCQETIEVRNPKRIIRLDKPKN